MPQRIIIYRRTDNNGEIAWNDENEEVIGNWTFWRKTEDGNGIQIAEICISHNLVNSSTFIPRNQERRNPATWANHDGENYRQIDYFAISHKCRNRLLQLDNKNNAC